MDTSMERFRGVSDRYLGRLTQVLAALDRNELDAAIERIDAAWRRGAQILIVGNGGSAITALHFATDWGKGVSLGTGRRLLARTLIDNMGLVTAYGNDIAFADIFAEQLKIIMRAGDLVLAISGSGNSENIIRAIDYANANGGETLGLSGFSGGRLKQRAQVSVWVNSDDMQLCEDAHAMFGHIVMQALCAHPT